MSRLLDRLSSGGVEMTWRRLARQGFGAFTVAAVFVTGLGFGTFFGLVAAGAEVDQEGVGQVMLTNLLFVFVGWQVWSRLGDDDAPNPWRWKREH